MFSSKFNSNGDNLVITQESLYHTKNVDFKIDSIEFPNGYKNRYGSIKHPGSSMVIAINDENEIVVIRQFRFCLSNYIFEFPSGTIENDENPLATMKRELEEETGFQAGYWKELGNIYDAPSYSNELIHLYLARDLTKIMYPKPQDKDEDIDIVLLTKDKIEALILSGEILDSASIALYHKALELV